MQDNQGADMPNINGPVQKPKVRYLKSLDELKEIFPWGQVWVIVPFEGRMIDEALEFANTKLKENMIKEYAVVTGKRKQNVVLEIHVVES